MACNEKENHVRTRATTSIHVYMPTLCRVKYLFSFKQENKARALSPPPPAPTAEGAGIAAHIYIHTHADALKNIYQTLYTPHNILSSLPQAGVQETPARALSTCPRGPTGRTWNGRWGRGCRGRAGCSEWEEAEEGGQAKVTTERSPRRYIHTFLVTKVYYVLTCIHSGVYTYLSCNNIFPCTNLHTLRAVSQVLRAFLVQYTSMC